MVTSLHLTSHRIPDISPLATYLPTQDLLTVEATVESTQIPQPQLLQPILVLLTSHPATLIHPHQQLQVTTTAHQLAETLRLDIQTAESPERLHSLQLVK